MEQIIVVIVGVCVSIIVGYVQGCIAGAEITTKKFQEEALKKGYMECDQITGKIKWK